MSEDSSDDSVKIIETIRVDKKKKKKKHKHKNDRYVLYYIHLNSMLITHAI